MRLSHTLRPGSAWRQALGACTFVRMENEIQRDAQAGARSFGSRVRAARGSRGWTQDELSRRMTAVGYPLHQTTIAKLESGTRPTSVEEMLVLGAVMGVPVSEFLEPGRPRSAEQEVAHELSSVEALMGQIKLRRTELQAQLAATDAELEDVLTLRAELLHRLVRAVSAGEDEDDGERQEAH